ncbi:efflux RND transporter periplasmic adaptor subunit [Microbulbifer sp. CAU 1566]|uniref:efflux RND transporter periplasmic adaptor subunit n=1 Tax=Microbulbifer sp. CAU 1566 TaxID=2933269 RepID=UPI0020046668|nr:efflux RND transporter periplasmic adaptor subunit [Microbulbifer sp. CAU 1566]MCK7597575.1 efflux RND transporter periplasmic adaptor subunit [Microbulbifer sp. CAU 1566]
MMYQTLRNLLRWRNLVVAACLLPLGCGEKEAAKPAPPPKKVEVVEAQRMRFRPSFEVPAVVEAVETAQIFPLVASRILYQNIAPGKYFKQGEELVRLDPYPFETKVATAESSIAEAMSTYEQTKANFDRARNLRPQGYISAKDFDTAKSAMQAAEAQLNTAQTALQQARQDLSHTSIVAPFSGRVGHPNYAVGDFFILPNSVPITQLVKVDPVYVLAHIGQKAYNEFYGAIEKLKQQGRAIPNMELYIVLPGDTVYPFKGEFFSWDATAAATRGTVAARILFHNPDGLLLPEENVTLHGKLLEEVERIVIPQKAVSQDQQGHFVYLLDKDSKVKRANIEVGMRIGANWAVPKGLKVGDRVLVEGLQKVSPGDAVEVTPVKIEQLEDPTPPNLRPAPHSLREQLRREREAFQEYQRSTMEIRQQNQPGDVYTPYDTGK